MSTQGERKIICMNAMTIIAYANQIYPTPFDIDVDRRRSSINAILHQLFDHRSRTFDHFPCCNLIS
jgi:hypothetical protein